MNKTIVNFILDKSGSMQSVREATISGFNEYVQTLKNDKKSKYEFTLTLFDTNFDIVVDREDIREVPKLTASMYNPDGMTALYDAVCTTLNRYRGVKGDMKKCKECGEDRHTVKHIAVIMTDGEENSSREYNQTDMRNMIEKLEAQGNWTFVYLGANQDSYANAAKYGISKGNTANFFASTAGTGAVFRGMGNATVTYSTSNLSTTTDFLQDEKQDIENTK